MMKNGLKMLGQLALAIVGGANCPGWFNGSNF